MSNMKKRMLSIAVAAMMLFTCIPAMAAPVAASSEEPAAIETDVSEVSTEPSEVAGGSCGTNATWTLDSDGLLTISGSGRIDDRLYDYAESITKVVIEEGITSICDGAFQNCKKMEEVVIPDSVTSIQRTAFANCKSLKIVVLPKMLKEIERSVFVGCTNLESVILPKNLNTIGKSAFYGCDSLKEINVPAGTEKIDDWAFAWSINLESVTLPDSVTELGAYAFTSCKRLKTVVLPNDIDTIKENTFSHCDLECVSIPDSVKIIGNSAFAGCDNLQEVIMSEKVTHIGESAFSGCSVLETVNLPESLTEIGNKAFRSCVKLSTATLPKNLTVLGEESFSTCRALTNVSIPEGVSVIGASAFSGCSALEEVVIAEGVSVIENGAFSGCNVLKEIQLPESIESIGDSAFSYTAITGLIIPDGVQAIGGYAFSECHNLVNITIPDSVTAVGERAFYGCSALEEIVIPESVEEIGYGVFGACRKLESVSLPSSVTTIGAYAFSSCENLASMSIPENVIEIGDGAFQSCTKLTEVEIPASTKHIGNSAFYYCYNLKNITIPEGVETLGDHVFDSCNRLEAIILPNSIISIGMNSFPASDSLVIYANKDTVGYKYGIENGLNIQPVYDVLFDETSVTMERNDSYTLVPAITKYGEVISETPEIIWSTSDESVIKVTEEGEMLAVGTGTANVKASCAGSSATVEVTVIAPAAGITLNSTEKTIFIDDAVELMAITEPFDTTDAVIWTSDNSAVISVTQEGVFEVVSAGMASITASCGNVSASCKITVENSITKAQTTIEKVVYDYTGSEIIPEISVTYKDKVLKEGTDYKVECTDNIDPGIATAVVSGTGRYSGEVSLTFTVEKTLLDEDVILDSADAVYCGMPIQKDVTVYDNGKVLIEGDDYTVEHINNLNAGEATVKITGKGFYKGIVIKTFEIEKAEQSITAAVTAGSVHAGKMIYATVEGIGNSLFDSSDSSIASVDEHGAITGKSVGTVTITVTAAGDENYRAASRTFEISVYCNHEDEPVISAPYKAPGCETEGAEVELSCPTCGTVMQEAIVIPATNHTWDTEYTVDRESTCTENGSKSIHCTVCGDLQEGSEVSLPIKGHEYAKKLTKAAKPGVNGTMLNACANCSDSYTTIIAAPKAMTFSKTSLGYNGKVQKPTVMIKDADGNVIPPANYTVSYSGGCKNIGTYTAKVAFKGNYSGTMSKSFKIVKGTQTISASNKAVTIGSKVSLKAKRTKGNGALSYTSSNKKVATVSSTGKVTAKAVGTAYITITAKGTSTYNKAVKKVKITVNPKGKSLSSVVSDKNGQFTAKWKKASGITGYQIRYSTKSSMAGAKTVTVSKASTLSKTVSGLTKGAKYYVQLRTYKTVKGTKYYSSWSAKKTRASMNASLSKTKHSMRYGTSTTLKVKNTSGKKVKWTTSNKKIATVSSSGKVSAKKTGTCTITATVGKQKLTCRLTVNNLYTDSKLHISGKMIGRTGEYMSVYGIQISNQGNESIVIDGYGWIYPFGMQANTMTKTSPYYGLPPDITIGAGKTKVFYVYPERDTLLSDSAEFKTMITYKGKTYFVTINKNGGGVYI